MKSWQEIWSDRTNDPNIVRDIARYSTHILRKRLREPDPEYPDHLLTDKLFFRRKGTIKPHHPKKS